MPSLKWLDFIEWFILFSEIGPVMCIIVMEIEFLDFTVCIPGHYRKFSKAIPSLCRKNILDNSKPNLKRKERE